MRRLPSNGGAAWSHVDPFTLFPASVGGFCCDQIVLYDPKHKIWIWLLQYSSTAAGNNIFRLAVSRDASFGSWYYWDFAPTNLNAAWTTMWFDYPDMAFTNNNLFVTINGFIGNAWQRAFVFRFPLATLAAGTSLATIGGRRRTTARSAYARGPGAVMHFGSHNSLSQIRVFDWPDSSTSHNVDRTSTYDPGQQGPYSSEPGRRRHQLARPRGLAHNRGVGWRGPDRVHVDGRPRFQPPVHVHSRLSHERGDEGACGRARYLEHEWGVGLSCGGDEQRAAKSGSAPSMADWTNHHPGHVVGVRTATAWDTVLTATSTNDPSTPAWGDYLSCVPHSPTPAHWVASGYSIQGGTARTNVVPRYVEFQA